MSRRVLREFVVLACSAAGAIVGYCAGLEYEPTLQLALPFLGMALGGAFAEVCIGG